MADHGPALWNHAGPGSERSSRWCYAPLMAPALRGLTAVFVALAGCQSPAPAVDLEAPDLAAPDLAPEDDPDLRLPPVTGPERLSETGLYADIAARRLAPGVRPYAPRYPLWSDGSEKERFLLLPDGQPIDTSDADEWRFPVGTRAWKHFRVGGRLIETRLLWKVRGEEGASRHKGWWKVSYVWNDAGTEAFAAPAGLPDAAGTLHDVPKQEGCDDCHRSAPDVLLGVSALQLSAGDGSGLLLQLGREGRLSAPAVELSPPGDAVTRAALGYLHGNCGGCHNGRNPLINARLLRMELHAADRKPEDTELYQTAIGAPLKHVLPDGQTVVVVRGQPDASGLLGRMKIRDKSEWQMPPLGSEVVDDAGVAAVRAWIAALPPR